MPRRYSHIKQGSKRDIERKAAREMKMLQQQKDLEEKKALDEQALQEQALQEKQAMEKKARRQARAMAKKLAQEEKRARKILRALVKELAALLPEDRHSGCWTGDWGELDHQNTGPEDQT